MVSTGVFLVFLYVSYRIQNIHVLFHSCVFLVFGLPLLSRLQKGVREDFETFFLLKYRFTVVYLKNDLQVHISLFLYAFRFQARRGVQGRKGKVG